MSRFSESFFTGSQNDSSTNWIVPVFEISVALPIHDLYNIYVLHVKQIIIHFKCKI